MGEKKDKGRTAAFELFPVLDGYFRIDGGAMFGAVPKVLWSKFAVPDRKNRVRLSLNCLLIRSLDKTILVDTGLGDQYSKKTVELYGMERKSDLFSSLARLKVDPAQIDYVINTHLHFDHCGGNTRKSDGEYIPAFPNAMYVIQRQEWYSASNPDERSRASYRVNDFKPVEDAGKVIFVDGDAEVVPGVKVMLTNGHTLGHQSVMITGRSGTALYLGDVMPTAHHLKPHYLTGFDEYPVDLLHRKKDLIERALKEKWLLIFEHDPAIVFAHLTEKSGKLSLEPLDAGWTSVNI